MQSDKVMDYLNIFAETVADYMLKENLTAKAFAERTGVAATAVGYWLKRQIFPTVESAIKVADCLQCSLDYLFGLSENPAYMPGSGNGHFLDRFNSLCAARKTTYYRVSKDAHIAHSAITKWVKGRYIKIESLIKLATYFDVSLDYLVGRSDAK